MDFADGREQEQWRRIRRRYATSGGTKTNVLVGNGNTTLTVTFPRTEADTQYGVLIQPSWDTRASVTTKTTTGFTVGFSTAAGASDVIDYIIFRTED